MNSLISRSNWELAVGLRFCYACRSPFDKAGIYQDLSKRLKGDCSLILMEKDDREKYDLIVTLKGCPRECSEISEGADSYLTLVGTDTAYIAEKIRESINMDIVTCRQMKDIEKEADEKGLPYLQMMENAGTASYRFIMDNSRPSSAAIYCGKGNNGGDGFVIARLMEEQGIDVTVILVDGEPKTHDAMLNFERLKGVTITDKPVHADIIVDAIYGTGFHGMFNGRAGETATFINNENATVFAIDIPSGLNGDMDDNDELENDPVRANYTIAFHRLKPVHVCEKALPFLGEAICVDIGIDDVI